MSYTLYYQKFMGDKFVVARSKNLLKLLKIKTVTYGFSRRAFIEDNNKKKEKFDKFDLSDADRVLFNNFEKKVNSGRYFPTYDYNQRAREHHLATL